jgi:MFS family permease
LKTSLELTLNKFKNILNTTLISLRNRNYRLFFFGQTASLVGTWMQVVAMSWLVYHLTNSALLLGLVGFFSQIPAFFIAPFAGVFIDRWNKHRILVITQILSMLQALALAVLTLTGTINIWHIVALSLGLGFINAFDMPARQAFVVEMVEKRSDMANAIALNSAMVNASRLIGPAVAGILVALVGEGYCFLINAISFMAVIVALLAMRIKKFHPASSGKNVLHEVKEGFRYAFGSTPIRWLLILLGIISIAGMPYAVLMPIFAKDILKGSSYTLGFLMASSGVGALIGGIYLAARKTVLGLGKVLAAAAAIFGGGLIFFGISKILWLSLIMMIFTGFGMLINIAAVNTILQTITEDDKRGRVMSFYTMAFIGMTPIGNLLAGILAEAIGAPNTIIISGAVCILGAIIFSIKLPSIKLAAKPVYIEKGIIVE